ncbi:hypothetical protein KVQ90_25050, partial [Escherichia coli]|nr:hypothetical protein [Escherichia coli]
LVVEVVVVPHTVVSVEVKVARIAEVVVHVAVTVRRRDVTLPPALPVGEEEGRRGGEEGEGEGVRRRELGGGGGV